MVEAKAEVDGKLAASGTLTLLLGANQDLKGVKSVFEKILIANRGEIAVRIIRRLRIGDCNCGGLFRGKGLQDAFHTMLADEAVCIGPARSTELYPNMNNIISGGHCDEPRPFTQVLAF